MSLYGLFTKIETLFPENIEWVNILRYLETLKTNHERIDFVYNHVLQRGFFPLEKINKSNERSLQLRKEGNKMFCAKKNLEALQLYTESIAFAENDSSNLGLAYANRSAILFEQEYYNECLEDIARALESKYPDNLRDKLFKRRERALSLKTKSKSTCYYEPAPNISNKNSQILSAADCVQLKQNQTFGTHVITTRDVKAGEVIVVEKPYVHTVFSESRLLHCNECLDLCFDMIPCDKCPLGLFCSNACKNASLKSFHRYECGLELFVHLRDPYVRLTLLGAKEHKSLDKDKSDKIYRSDRYKEISQLESNESKMGISNLLFIALTSGIIFHGFKYNTNFLQETDWDENTLKDNIYHNMLIQVTNGTAIVKRRVEPLSSIFEAVVGIGLYSFFSRFNHSCAPNCMADFHGTNIVVRTMKDIKKGEQCTISYRWHYASHSFTTRQSALEGLFHFTCKCVACENMWPTLLELLAQRQTANDFAIARYVSKLMESVREDISISNRNKILSKCFQLQTSLEEPSVHLIQIQRFIVSGVMALSGNKFITF